MHAAQAEVNQRWEAEGLPRSGWGSACRPARPPPLLGSEERIEYTLVGDTVNLSQRLQQWAEPGETVLSEPTVSALDGAVTATALEPATVKGRATPVQAYKISATESS